MTFTINPHAALHLDKVKDVFAMPLLPLVTVYDDNFFLANDYDILSLGQRQHIQRHLSKHGFKQTSGKVMKGASVSVLFPKPNHLLAQSNFQEQYLNQQSTTVYVVTPTCFAECLFYYFSADQQQRLIESLQQLITHCPFNIEYLRCISLNRDIESQVHTLLPMLIDYQNCIIEQNFKHKRAY